MKRKNPAIEDKDVVAAIRLLRYGPSRRSSGNLRIMTYSAIGKALSLSPTTVRNYLKRSELLVQEEMDQRRTKTRGGLKRLREDKRRPTELSEEQLGWILSRETLIQQVGLTIAERRAQFLRRYPDRQISESKYWKLYRKHNVRKKKIKITKINDANRERRIRRETEFMAQQLQVMIQRGFRIVYLDETMVTTKTIPTHEWSGVNQQVQVDQRQYGRKAIAVLAGVS